VSKKCQIQAGLCPKPEHTYGEPHYCTLPAGHSGRLHKCRCCSMKFNVDSMSLMFDEHAAAQKARKKRATVGRLSFRRT
jgi:hypothetical protein